MSETRHAGADMAGARNAARNAASEAASGADPGRLGRRLDGLIGMLSHDLRTPLSAISGWLFLLESGKLDHEAQRRALSKIRASVEEQVQLIDDTLLISRGQTGRVEISASPLRLHDCLAPAIDAFTSQAAAKGVGLDVSATPAEASIDGNGELLRRAFVQLLTHALKSTPAGGQIHVSSAVAPERIEVEIRDTGAGFSSADLPYVLDPFRPPAAGEAPAPRGPERSLLLAQAVIAAHHGTLAVASEGSGLGETFTIALPRAGEVGRTGVNP